MGSDRRLLDGLPRANPVSVGLELLEWAPWWPWCDNNSAAHEAAKESCRGSWGSARLVRGGHGTADGRRRRRRRLSD